MSQKFNGQKISSEQGGALGESGIIFIALPSKMR